MGSTIVTQKKVAVIPSASGELFYALFSQSYESNVYPKSPHWSCNYFGTAAACMQWIIRDAACTEGGMLKGGHGRSTPTAWLKQWRQEMASPAKMRGHIVSCKVGNGFYEVSEEKRSVVESVLKRFGLEIVNNEIRIDLTERPQALSALREEAEIPMWKCIGGTAFDAGDVQEWAGYAPVPQEAKSPEFKVFYVQEGKDEREHWVATESGDARHLGWAYSTIEGLIVEYAGASEAERPGSAESAMRVVRKMVERDAAAMSHRQSITVYRRAAEHRWHEQCYDRLAEKLQRDVPELATTLHEVMGADAFDDLKSLPSTMVKLPGLWKSLDDRGADLFAA